MTTTHVGEPDGIFISQLQTGPALVGMLKSTSIELCLSLLLYVSLSNKTKKTENCASPSDFLIQEVSIGPRKKFLLLMLLPIRDRTARPKSLVLTLRPCLGFSGFFLEINHWQRRQDIISGILNELGIDLKDVVNKPGKTLKMAFE